MLDAGCRDVFWPWKADFVTHDEVHCGYSKTRNAHSEQNRNKTVKGRIDGSALIFCKRRWQRARSSRMVSETIESLITNAF